MMRTCVRAIQTITPKGIVVNMDNEKSFEQKVQEYNEATEVENRRFFTSSFFVAGALGLTFALVPLIWGGKASWAAIIAGIVLISAGLFKREKDKTK